MTINDMLDAGIGIENKVEVRAYLDEERYRVYIKQTWDTMNIIPDDIKEKEIIYMFSAVEIQNGSILVIEVNAEE